MLDRFYFLVFRWVITRLFGPKCGDFMPECMTCQQWALYEKAAGVLYE